MCNLCICIDLCIHTFHLQTCGIPMPWSGSTGGYCEVMCMGMKLLGRISEYNIIWIFCWIQRGKHCQL